MTGVFNVSKYIQSGRTACLARAGERVLLHQIIHTSDNQALEWIKVLSDSSNH